jgi:spore germination cell wall hydrolase CwlJ-like protein
MAPAILCLAMVVSGEARGEPLYGQIGVAMVVENRARERHTPICKTASEPFQFAKRAGPSFSCLYAAWIADKLYYYLPSMLRQAWYFHSGHLTPKYGKYLMTIGNHRFYAR